MLMLSARLVQIIIALTFFGSSMSLFAAHSQLYAVVGGNINVYKVSNNGTLTLDETVVPPGPVTELAATPDGRFLYAIREIGDMVEYIVREHGSLQQEARRF